MIVTLIGKKSISKIKLPRTAIGSYWFEENEKKVINIRGNDGKWEVTSNDISKIVNTKDLNITDNNITIINNKDVYLYNAILNENSVICMMSEITKEIYILYCEPSFKDDFLHIDLKNNLELSIGKNEKNLIVYNNALVSDEHAEIYKLNGKWYIENKDKKFGTFLNNKQVIEKRELKTGDIIYIMGLKIIWLENSFFINNPYNKMHYNKFELSLSADKNIALDTSDADENEIKLYKESDYYSRSPRIRNIIEAETIKIDAPPQKQNKDDMPAILVLGSTVSMGIIMMFSMYSTIDGFMNKTSSMKDTIISFLMSFIMLVSMVLFPVLSRKFEQKQKVKYESERKTRYIKYLNSKIVNINSIIKKQRESLMHNFPDVEECKNIILNRNDRLWEREIEDYDFLKIRLGIGDVPLTINMQYPEEQFTMDDDELVEKLKIVGKQSKLIDSAPVTISLVEKNIAAIIDEDKAEMKEYFRQLILQLITFHSYEDLKIVFLVDEDSNHEWDYVKNIPHLWNDSKSIRFFADNNEDMREISNYLEEEFQGRIKYENNNVDYRNFSPYYLIITDDYRKIENLKIINDILDSKINYGFSLLCLNGNTSELPHECKTFININKQVGMVYDSKISLSSEKINHEQFDFNSKIDVEFESIVKIIANIPIRFSASSELTLPTNYTFLEMYDAGNIEQLNILEKWNKNDSTLSLKAPLGIDGAGNQIVLDIHEKYHGPHGLIAGSTGSGKSEFIITYILSMAINYHPDDVTFLLIDYKGGGLAGAFAKKDVKLPHLVGTITNIDKVGLQRSLDSIQSELRRRQVMFNEARDLTDESTIDIYKYQKLYHDGVVKKAIPHLFIICDEFAELKQQQEDFMDELMSVSRIGRSLGVHLILATQKPAGIVNDQIRSNSKFGICLKVQDKEDSVDVIKRPDAANLKRAGQFYIQVGNNEYFCLGQSAWAGAPYIPADSTKKKIDTSLEIVNNIGNVIKKIDNDNQKSLNSVGDQLTSIVKYIYQLAEHENIRAEQLWLDSIPENIYIEDIRKKYKVKDKENNICPVIGEYDDPFNQQQGVVNVNFTGDGNTILYGSADSGKETLLSTIVYDTMKTHTPNEVQMYILDFGTEALKIFKNSPNVGDVVFLSEKEKIGRLFDMLQKEVKERKQILSEYNGEYELFLKDKKKKMPMIIVMINGYEAFTESYEDDYDDILQTLTREGVKCGIVFLITASTYNDVRYRLAQNFKQTIALQLNNEDDYFNIFEKVGKKRPSHLFGRGLVNLSDGEIYEFQTAKICEAENWNTKIQNTIESLNKEYGIKADRIPVLPDKVTLEDVKEGLKNMSSVPLGMIKKNLNIYNYNFTKDFINIITAKNIEDSINYTIHVIEELKLLKDVDIQLFDEERVINTKKTDITSEFNNFVENISEKGTYTVCIIVGVDKFINEIGEDEFEEMLKKVEDSQNCNIIIVENASKLKNREYDTWYKDYLTGESGIWVGNGIDDQYLINVTTNSRDLENNCGQSFGYVVKQGEAILIKLLGINNKEDENE